MKKLLLISLLLLLNGCLYSFEEECFRPLIQVGSSGCYKNKGDIFPSIARFQKVENIGKTDAKQHWKDAVDCGSKYGDEDLIYINDNNLYSIFHSCMIKKGYKKFHPVECGYQNPKWDKGVCNL
ncbi:hypothetical protein [Pasteurella multocida]|uniref:hypothetical protein n=1 Tax=Pasteurella multocida TaxID=747 RepID=UPI00397B0575